MGPTLKWQNAVMGTLNSIMSWCEMSCACEFTFFCWLDGGFVIRSWKWWEGAFKIKEVQACPMLILSCIYNACVTNLLFFLANACVTYLVPHK